MNEYYFNPILSLIPVLIAVFAAVLLLVRYYNFKQRHHLFLFIVFLLLAYTYAFSLAYSTKNYSIIALLFPFRQPVNLLLIPFSSFYGYILFLGVRIPLRKMIIHVLPALFVFIGFIPFWFLQPELQTSYLSLGLSSDMENTILHNTELLRKVSVYFIFNFQFVVYNAYIIYKFRKFDKQSPVTLHSHPGAGSVSVILLFVSFLFVMINNALVLGIAFNINSRIFFNSASIVILLAFFISGYKSRQCIAKWEIQDIENDEPIDDDSIDDGSSD
ncbi:hypothetical protein SDC9_77010 [bioreactor metagenome]|uniref:Histidine kinase N-terminal 7TM region domain-containing protein n=1 Tax=bioreactor metagenome TaxID=1076179 RepID=A0A644YPS1_9ZZZZ